MPQDVHWPNKKSNTKISVLFDVAQYTLSNIAVFLHVFDFCSSCFAYIVFVAYYLVCCMLLLFYILYVLCIKRTNCLLICYKSYIGQTKRALRSVTLMLQNFVGGQILLTLFITF